MKTILKTAVLFLLFLVISCNEEYAEPPVSGGSLKEVSEVAASVIPETTPAQTLPEGWPADNGGGVMNLTINGQSVKVPYYSNKPINQIDNSIKKVVIAVHGINRWSKVILNRIMTSANRDNLPNETLVLCPVFLEEDEYEFYLAQNKLDVSYPWWKDGGWKYGHLSRDTPIRTSSYDVIDEMVDVIEQNNPNLESIVYTGFSAGGQFANRYAAAGRGPNTLPQSIDQRFIVHAPSSYVYLSDKRWTSSGFQTPGNSCNNYDRYIYGLGGNFNSYLNITTLPTIINNYKNRNVIHMVGRNDITTSNLDQSCRANLQGTNRVDRAIKYYEHVLEEFGATPQYTTNKYLLIVDGKNHTSRVYETVEAGKYMFDDLSILPNTSETRIVHFVKNNAAQYAMDGGSGGVNNQNIRLYSANPNDVNQQWVEIDRGGGYYSYKKQGTTKCIDSYQSGNRNNVKLWNCGTNNYNQHWKKIATNGGSTFMFRKRNANNYAIDGNSGASNGTNVHMWSASTGNSNQQWRVSTVGN